MFVSTHGMQVFGFSPQQKTPHAVSNFHQHRASMTNLQFLGSLVDNAQKKKHTDSKRQIKGILKNAISMPNLAQNSDHPKIDHKQLKNVFKRQKRPFVEKATKKTVKFNDPVGRLGQIESKYKLCSAESSTEGVSLRKHKKIQQISLRNALSENKSDSSNVLVTVVYDLKLKENKMITNNNPETKVKTTGNCKPEGNNDYDNSDSFTGRREPNEASTKETANIAFSQNGDTFLSHTVIAPVLPTSEKFKPIDNEGHWLNISTPSEDLKNKQTTAKPKDSLVVTRSRAKPIMFTRCVNNTAIQIVEDPVNNTTNFCDDEKTSHIIRWLNDVKHEQERDGFCTLLISDGENKY